MLYLDRTPEQALHGFTVSAPWGDTTNRRGGKPPLPEDSNNSSKCPLQSTAAPTLAFVPSFHDASQVASNFVLTVMDCLQGLAKARMYGFFDFSNFDVAEYEHFEQVEVRL